MKAMVLTGIRKIEIVEQPAPALQHPTDILLRIVRAGICGSDLHYYTQGGLETKIVRFPFCVGHELPLSGRSRLRSGSTIFESRELTSLTPRTLPLSQSRQALQCLILWRCRGTRRLFTIPDRYRTAKSEWSFMNRNRWE